MDMKQDEENKHEYSEGRFQMLVEAGNADEACEQFRAKLLQGIKSKEEKEMMADGTKIFLNECYEVRRITKPMIIHFQELSAYDGGLSSITCMVPTGGCFRDLGVYGYDTARKGKSKDITPFVIKQDGVWICGPDVSR